MASPWKLFTRLVSPRRQPKAAADTADQARLDASSTALNEDALPGDVPPNDATKAPDDRLAEKTQTGDQPDAPESAERFDETTTGDRSALPDDTGSAAALAPVSARTSSKNPMVRKRRRNQAKTARVISEPAPDIVLPVSSPVGLDEEIRLLRNQLSEKLRLQNAQLRRMLERFDR